MLLLSLGEHQLVFTVEEDAKPTLTIRGGIDEGHHNARASTVDGQAWGWHPPLLWTWGSPVAQGDEAAGGAFQLSSLCTLD
jgi:hypothetical protein